MPDLRPRILAVRLDSLGDVLLTGPALRALAHGSSRLELLVSPAGAPAAELLPGLDDVLTFDAPWTGFRPPPVDAPALLHLIEDLSRRRYDEAVIFTSFHQSPLPMALVARLAGIPRVIATSEDYAGSLLDVRHRRLEDGATDTGGAEGGHEVLAALALCRAAGYGPAPEDDLRLRVKPSGGQADPIPDLPASYVVVHPTASVPSRSIDERQLAEMSTGLTEAGWTVVVTGETTAAGIETAGPLDHPGVIDVRGRTTFAELTRVLEAAACVVAVNSGPGHLAAAVGTPVVSLFAPVVPVERWGPWGVPSRVLGDQEAPCRGTRARLCPVPGHPCLSSVSVAELVAAVNAIVVSGPPEQAEDQVVVA